MWKQAEPHCPRRGLPDRDPLAEGLGSRSSLPFEWLPCEQCRQRFCLSPVAKELWEVGGEAFCSPRLPRVPHPELLQGCGPGGRAQGQKHLARARDRLFPSSSEAAPRCSSPVDNDSEGSAGQSQDENCKWPLSPTFLTPAREGREILQAFWGRGRGVRFTLCQASLFLMGKAIPPWEFGWKDPPPPSLPSHCQLCPPANLPPSLSPLALLPVAGGKEPT